MLKNIPQCIIFNRNFRKYSIKMWYAVIHRLSMPGNSNIMHYGIFSNTRYTFIDIEKITLYTSLPVHGMSDKLGVPCATKQHQQKLQRQVTVRNNTCIVVCTWKNSSGDLIDIETSMSVAGIVCLLVTEKMVAMRSDKNVLWFHQTRYDIFELMPCKNMLGQAYQTFETPGKTLVRSHKLSLYTSQLTYCIIRHFSSSNNTKRPPILRLHEVHNII